MTSNYGHKGLAWDLKDGAPYVTAFGKKALPTNEVPVPAAYGVNAMNYANVNVNSINPDTKEPYNYVMWKSTIANSSKLDKSWQAAMKASTLKDYIVKNKMISVAPVTIFSAASPDSSTLQKQNQIKTVIVQDSWKMVFAKSDSEYNALQKDMITKSKGLGYDDVLKFWEG